MAGFFSNGGVVAARGWLFVILLLSGCSHPSIVGKWHDTAKHDNSGIEFFKGETADVHFQANGKYQDWPATYKLDGNKLSLMHPLMSTISEVEFTDNDHIVLTPLSDREDIKHWQRVSAWGDQK